MKIRIDGKIATVAYTSACRTEIEVLRRGYTVFSAVRDGAVYDLPRSASVADLEALGFVVQCDNL